MRILKQFIYGIFYLAIWAGVGFGVYSYITYVPLTCFDNIQNQMEEAVDCGPALAGLTPLTMDPDGKAIKPNGCIPCELKNIKLSVSEPKIYPVSDASSTIIVEINNQSQNYGLKKFNYTIRVFDKNSNIRLLEKSGEASIFPGEKKYLVASAIGIDYREAGKMTVELGPLNWALKAAMPAKLNVSLSGVAYNTSNSSIGGFINNNSPAVIRTVNILGTAHDATGRIVRASSAPFENVAPFAVVPFSVFIQTGEYSRVEAYLDLPVQ